MGYVSRGEGFTSPHFIRLAAVPLPALVNSDKVGMGKAGTKKCKRKRHAENPKEREGDSEKESPATPNLPTISSEK
jgi:hypothetical protein